MTALAGLRTDGGLIAEIGPGVEPRPGDEVIDGAGLAIVPGLVNGHTHAAMTLFRGHGDDLPLMEWLETKIWPLEARLTENDVYWGARLACVEMIRTGTVRFWDMYWHPEATARAVADAGLTAVIGAPLIDGLDPARGAELRAAALASLDGLAEAAGRIDASLAPHAIYTVSEDSLRWIAEAAEERGLPVHIHLAETAAEVERCIAEHGERPAAYLDRVGLLGRRTMLAHCVWLDDAELDLVAERGATIVTNPVANMKLAVGGTFRYPAARQRGIPVALGTDGAGSNNSLDLFQDMKLFALAQKNAAGDPAAVTAPEAFEVAAGLRAPLVAPWGGAGPLQAGGPADFLLVRTAAAELTPGDLTSNLVYAASGGIVDTTIVHGRVLMRGGIVDGADEIRDHALEQARRLGTAR